MCSTPGFINGLGWAALKVSVIGYYPDELVVHVLIPVVAGLGPLGLERYRTHDGAEC